MRHSPKEAGEHIESLTLDRFEMIEPVDATDWYDGIVIENAAGVSVLESAGVPAYMNEFLCLHVGDVVEVKAAQQRLASGSRGRYYLRREQHAKLLDADAVYLFVVYDPDEYNVLSMAFVPAKTVDGKLPGGWTNVRGSRYETGFRQLTWTHFIPPGVPKT